MKISKPTQIKSLVLLLILLFQVFYPTAAFALADGPEQPDFASYENFNSTDMVDLITGDFNYNIPLLEVPSPEGSYQIPLSYHSGIQLNEESSWVGLGWGLNPGVTTRAVSVYPDDFSGEVATTSITSPGGNGYIKTNAFIKEYYDSEKGKGGTVNLAVVDFGWGSEKHFGISPTGLTLKDHKISYDLGYMLQGLSNVADIATIASGNPAGIFVLMSDALIAMGNAADMKAQAGISQNGNWTVQKNLQKRLGTFFSTLYYKWYLDDNKFNSQFGTLYLGNMDFDNATPYANFNVFNKAWPTTGTPPTNLTLNNNVIRAYATHSNSPATYISSDMYIYYSNNYGKDYLPTSLAYDNFSVKAPSISGAIKPYREDIGTFSNPTAITNFLNDIYTGPRFLPFDYYRVQFKYEGDISNSYTFHHMGTNPNLESQDFPYEFDGTQYSSGTYDFKFLFKDPKVYLNYFANVSHGAYTDNWIQSRRIDTTRDGHTIDRRLVHGKHIEWFTNDDITNTNSAHYAKDFGFMDTHQGYDRVTDTKIPDNGIGGFSITNEAGMTYHFAIPVYNKNEYFHVNDTSAANTKYDVTNENYYATMWLLTGITGPDFVDRGTVGIIDDQDWGYWVKFDYGKFSSTYNWRDPYFGFVVNGSSKSYKEGVKETYYLDKISTRSHTALFAKSVKNDGKSAYRNPGAGANMRDILDPASSLKLDDIYVLENSDYQKLVTPTASGGIGLTTNGTSKYSEIVSSDTYSNVIDNHDLASAGVQNFLNSNQLQKIHFNYNYELCSQTYNSFNIATLSGSYPVYTPTVGYSASTLTTNINGKLTLKSVEFSAKNNTRVMPGYLFDYNASDPDQNPNYHPYKWDGYGIYKSGGSGPDYTPHNCEKPADQWCLKKITTPLGGEIDVEYERDDYTSVFGRPVTDSPLRLIPASNNVGAGATANITLAGANAGAGTLNDLIGSQDDIDVTYTDATGNHVLSSSIGNISGNTINMANNLPANSTIVEVGVKAAKKYGSNVRVKSIKTRDENNNEYETRYLYTKDGTENGVSSGVASYEPEFDRVSAGNFSFYEAFDHPYNPVLYSYVTAVNGRFDNVFKETSKTTFHFVTPRGSMVEITPNIMYETPHATPLFSNSSAKYYAAWGMFTTIDRTSSIGVVDTIKEYNRFNNLTGKTVFDYTDNSNNEYGNNMGNYTENTILWESINYVPPPQREYNMRFFQSYKLKRPNILKSVTTYKDRLVSKQEILSYDYHTGQPLSTRNTYGNFEKYESKQVPAYTIYPKMDSKAYDITNRNIITAPVENISYVYDKNNQKQVLGASVTTWGNYNNFNYREYNTSTGWYESQNNPVGSSPYSTIYVWLPYQTYSYKTPVEENGVVKGTFTDFNFSGLSSTNWVRTAQVTLYDRYSHPIEAQGLQEPVGNYNFATKIASTKYGYNNAYAISSNANAKYTNWCYSGAEDQSTVSTYFEGEVKGSNTRFASSTYAHTGNFCSRMTPSLEGFSFRIKKSDLPFIFTSKYRASVWVHQNNYQSAYFTCAGFSSANNLVFSPGAISGGAGYTNPISIGTIEQAGNWYLLSIDIDMASVPYNVDYLKFYIQHNGASGYVFADDFRVHPLSDPITCNVYEPKTTKIIATLDKDNYATKFEYDNAGKLVAVYKESKLGFKKVSETRYNYSR